MNNPVNLSRRGWVGVLTLVLFGSSKPVVSLQEPSDLGGLEAVFSVGPLFQDRNNDGVADFVDARLILGAEPSLADIASAADIAARLGYETMAMNLPLPGSDAPGGVGILVGTGGVERAGLSKADAGLAGLKPGEGVVQWVSANGRPWVVVAGPDQAGTQAAVMALAGYLPHAGEPEGVELHQVAQDVKEFLTDQALEVGPVHVSSLHVKDARPGFERLTVEAALPSIAAMRRARTVLQGLPRRVGVQKPEERPALSYPGVRTLRIVLQSTGAASASVDVPRAEPEKKGGPIPARPGTTAKRDLDLSSFYTNDGFLGDSDSNLIPDRVDVLLSPSGQGVGRTVDLAARLGLESTGILIPSVRLPETIEDPEKEPTLVLIGLQHPLVKKMIEDKKLQNPSLGAGEGLIQVVPEAFGEKGAVILAGGDEQGLDRALQQVAERFPNVWERGKDRTTLDQIEEDVWRFLSGRSPGGQAAIALYKLDQILAELSGKDIEKASVLVSIEKPAEGLEEIARQKAAALGADSLEVTLDNRDVQKASVVISEAFEVPSEVDAFWKVFHSKVLPKVKKNRPIVLEARLSEPAEIRAQIEKQVREELAKKGARESDLSIRVLSAYKQGYSWLHDSVRPRLSGKAIGNIQIRFAEAGPPPEWKQQAMYTRLRWLKEIFPIDEVLAKELGIGLEKIRFEKRPVGSTTYEIVVTDPQGGEILREAFEPKFVLRPYADRFRDYEMVRVTTGWVRATVEGKPVCDERIVTDAERFWDHYQEKTLPAIYDYIMDLHEGNPRGDGKDAPYFGELTVELSLSEPNDLIGIQKEVDAPMDSLHEEVYFGTLWFFRLLGRHARGEELTYPGRVLPMMRPKNDGKPGQAKITFTGFATSRPAVVVEYQERGGNEGKSRLDVPKIAIERPRALGARVRADRNGLDRLHVWIKVNSEKDERGELVKRAPKEDVDEEVLSAEQVRAMVENLGRLRASGMYLDTLAYHDLGTLEFAAAWEREVKPETQIVTVLQPNGKPAPFPDIRRLLPADYEYQGENLVQWDTPMPPPEANAVMAKMSTFPEVTAYKAGETYLGKDVWAMDLMPPMEASHWSHAKATTLKPTIIYSARQHANEVSSTSHVLKLAEMLLTDPDYRKSLNKVNVIIQPVLNADGAQLAYDLYKITPEFILHAGYLGSLGMDVSSDWRKDFPLLTEAKVRPRLWASWLPDIFLNPHGYPSHQVVQLFSEFDGLVRRGRVTERDWSMNKGWFIPGFEVLDDPQYPRHEEAAFQIRDYITKAINAAPDVHAMNQRNYDRYRRYGFSFADEAYKMDMTDDVLIYMPLEGAKADPSGMREFNPKVTVWNGITEAPDETAHGDWMKIVATAGLQWDKAILQYLVDGKHKVERKCSRFWEGVGLSLDRPRPPKPEEKKEEGK